MSRSALHRIRDIRGAIEAIRQFEQSGRDEAMVFDAVRMRLLEIGEAVNGLPTSLLDIEPCVPWKQIIGMRNWMAHRYVDTVRAYVWATVDNDLSPLSTALDGLAKQLARAPAVGDEIPGPRIDDSND